MTLSKAPRISKKSAIAAPFLVRSAFSNLPTIIESAVSVDMPRQKPCCLSLRGLSFSAFELISQYTHLSIQMMLGRWV